MARIIADKENKEKEIKLDELRELIRSKIEKEFETVANFLSSPYGKELGGNKIRPYLYNSGPVSFNVLNKLCTYLKIGKLSRKVVVSRSFSYKLNKTVSDT